MSFLQVRCLCQLLVALLLIVWVENSQSASIRNTRHYAGSIPMGFDVKTFLQVCQLCGEFFGTAYSGSCVHDKTFQTFVLCITSVQARR